MRVRMTVEKEVGMPRFLNQTLRKDGCIIDTNQEFGNQFDCEGILCKDCIFQKANYEALQILNH